MSVAENSYGWRKRFDFVSEAIREAQPARVIDIGCGTGAALTVPLAKAFPAVEFLGVDSDPVSIGRARETAAANVSFSVDEPPPEGQFDMVIASEVLEHVDEPHAFLRRLRGFARPGGTLVVTVPNGYGPFEMCSLLETLLNLSGLQRVLRAILRPSRRRPADADAVDTGATTSTLAISPHINFYSRRAVLSLFDEAGFRLRRYRPTTFLCGYGIDLVMRGERVLAWNARIADRLPAWCASDWMFALEAAAPGAASGWRANAWGRFRRRLNLKRWGLA